MASNQYLNSEDVSIFPYAVPRANSTDNVFYEQNTTNIIRQITNTFFGTDSFVISSTLNAEEIEFCIHGYYFRVNTTALEDNWTSDTTLTAYIEVEKATTSTPEYIKGQDVGGKFQVLSFYPLTDSETTSVFSLDILDENGELITTPLLGFEAIDGAH